MIRHIIYKFRHSISTKLFSVFIFLAVIIFLTNISVNAYISKSLQKLDTVYSSNIISNKLSDKLIEVQSNVYEYLNTKSSASLVSYYKSEQEYRGLMESLNDQLIDNEMLMLEKNIRNMSDTYLTLTDETVKEKRGRNVEKYKKSYEDAKKLNQYIHSFISNLNTEQLKQNSQNYQKLMVSLNYTEVLSLAILIIIVVISLCLLVLILKNIIKPLVQLAHNANEVAQGNFNSDFIMPKSEDEVGLLYSTFDTMLKSIKHYIEQITEDMENEQRFKEQQLLMENHLKDAQLKYLQAQINPHFLFNSLNAGAQLAILEEADQTGLFLEKMADFFRYNVRKMEQDTTLKEEIEIVDNYIYIINVRMTGDIHFRKEVPEGLTDVMVPSMILQPVVENAVKHGISGMDSDGEIVLTVTEEEKNITITIKDNGIGMSMDKIEEVLSDGPVSSEAGDSTGIGLNNVRNRLMLYYGSENLMTIQSDGINRGTEVKIIIPGRGNTRQGGVNYVSNSNRR
ncbi:sensor histidine kinase [Anaerocolumna chitinilytica]|uniref:histidine kinase n=1 Tax=Anaerocolumna chitinilytica TaxID=1727145 RepID=A0A7I8DPL2_9FIRM|nr:histidine kinase [Anaerocolumna chitinilytica]BCK00344.1 hypothetical protein bsdcttw_33840 [Anaerocolumna chitinilytica]